MGSYPLTMRTFQIPPDLVLGCAAVALGLCACTAQREPLPSPPVADLTPLTRGPKQQLKALNDRFQSSPNDPELNFELAETLATYGVYAAAETYAKRALILKPQNFKAHYLLGWIYSQTPEKALDAAAQFDMALRYESKSLLALLRKADALRAASRFEEAEAVYQKLLDLEPTFPQALLGSAKARIALKKHSDAIPYLTRLVDNYPRYGAAHYSLAEAYRNTGQAQRAVSHLAAFEMAPNSEPEFEDPIVDSVKNRSRSHKSLSDRARKVANSGDFTEAAKLLEEAVLEDPNYISAYADLITCYGMMRDREAAIKAYERGTAVRPLAVLENSVGLLFKNTNDPVKAKAHFLKAIQLDPNHYTSYENLGHMAFANASLNEAMAHYQKAASISPYSYVSWVMIGTIHLRQGRKQPAQTAFLNAIRRGPEVDAAFTEVRQAYREARDERAWVEFAQAALPQVTKDGLASIAEDLQGVIKN
ncbi:hypothetical protein F183_A33340 [Bryobacterales bacterium F-183]|nr:hypothetical protein F183_A33340 [Bryobacterales bacterium F-183]